MPRNLVTNETWESFWLNEGWTKMLERKIMMRLRPPPRRRRRAGWQTAASRSAGRARRESVLLLEPFLLLSEPFGPCWAQEPPGGLCSRGAAHAARLTRRGARQGCAVRRRGRASTLTSSRPLDGATCRHGRGAGRRAGWQPLCAQSRGRRASRFTRFRDRSGFTRFRDRSGGRAGRTRSTTSRRSSSCRSRR